MEDTWVQSFQWFLFAIVCYIHLEMLVCTMVAEVPITHLADATMPRAGMRACG